MPPGIPAAIEDRQWRMMNPSDLTAAHRSLPFGTRVLVENLSNGHSVVVRINDRGPFTNGRIIDLSKAAASNLGMVAGVADVRVSVAEGGVLAELGESTAKENVTSRIKGDLIDVAQRDETPAVSAKMAGTDTNEAKAAPKPSGKTKIAAKTAKTKVLAAASAAKKRAASQTVKVAAKRSRPNESAKGRVQLAAANSGIRAAGREASRFSSRRTIVASARLREAGREAAKLLEPPDGRCIGRAQRNGTQGVQDLQPPHQRGIEDATPLPCPRHDAGNP